MSCFLQKERNTEQHKVLVLTFNIQPTAFKFLGTLCSYLLGSTGQVHVCVCVCVHKCGEKQPLYVKLFRAYGDQSSDSSQ